MKNGIIFLTLTALVLTFSSCDQDLEGYDTDKAYIYFDMPFKIDILGRKSKIRQDSVYYSFGLDRESVRDTVIEVPLAVIGVACDRDREYTVEVVAEQTTATDDDWDKSSISNCVVPAGETTARLPVRVKRSDATKTTWKQIVLRVTSNENFGQGYANLITAKVTFSSILPPPEWWNTWQTIMGPFYPEVFLKWREIYYLGADPNIKLYGDTGVGELLYWNNMPHAANHKWFPSTFVFLNILKQYFIDNEVYPDGDTSKPRILLPNFD